MFPTISRLLQLDRELRERLNKETDPFTKALIEDKIKQLSPQIIRQKVRQSLDREEFSRSYPTTDPAPIKCGLRGATGHHKPDKTEHWFWSGESDKQAKALEKTRQKLKELFFLEPDKDTVRKFTFLGGVRKTLKQISLQAVLELPASVRRDKSDLLMTLIKSKLNGDSPLKHLV
jgi:hypothetical protein